MRKKRSHAPWGVDYPKLDPTDAPIDRKDADDMEDEIREAQRFALLEMDL